MNDAAKGVLLIRMRPPNYHYRLASWFVRIGIMTHSAEDLLFADISRQPCHIYGAEEGLRMFEDFLDHIRPLLSFLHQPSKKC